MRSQVNVSLRISFLTHIILVRHQTRCVAEACSQRPGRYQDSLFNAPGKRRSSSSDSSQCFNPTSPRLGISSEFFTPALNCNHDSHRLLLPLPHGDGHAHGPSVSDLAVIESTRNSRVSINAARRPGLTEGSVRLAHILMSSSSIDQAPYTKV
jgi:hypothetical protein